MRLLLLDGCLSGRGGDVRVGQVSDLLHFRDLINVPVEPLAGGAHGGLRVVIEIPIGPPNGRNH